MDVVGVGCRVTVACSKLLPTQLSSPTTLIAGRTDVMASESPAGRAGPLLLCHLFFLAFHGRLYFPSIPAEYHQEKKSCGGRGEGKGECFAGRIERGIRGRVGGGGD